MAVVTAVVAGAAVAGAGIMSAQAKKKGAEQAAGAFKNVGRGIERMDRVERAISQLLGGDASLGEEGNRYNELQDQSYSIVRDQMNGQLSEATRAMLGRRALGTGATGLGRGAVQDAYTGYLGITTEQQAQTGFNNYRAMFGQLSSLAQQQMSMNYSMQYNQAAVQANTAMQVADANAGMWQAIGQGVSMAVGGIGGAAGGAGGAAGAGGGMGSMFGGGGGGWQGMVGNMLSSGMGGGGQSSGMQPSGAYYTAMAQAGRSPSTGSRYLGGI